MDSRQQNIKKIPGIKNVVAVASNKGGVGKSTIATNLAISLKRLDNKVGILDADITGPNIPRMLGIPSGSLAGEGQGLRTVEAHGVKAVSLGLVLPPDTPVVWRGPMIASGLKQMVFDVDWGDLDYLIIDLPPGTGDAQLTLAQSSKLSGAIIVSTPQDVALIDARKGINMFKRVEVPVLGIVENMSYFICSNCNERHEIFSHGGAKKEAEKFQTNFLGELPISVNLRINSDEGRPVCISEPESEIAKIYIKIAEKMNKDLH